MTGWLGKPHREQGQIGEQGWSGPLGLSGRPLDRSGNRPAREMTVAASSPDAGTEPGLQADLQAHFFRSAGPVVTDGIFRTPIREFPQRDLRLSAVRFGRMGRWVESPGSRLHVYRKGLP